MLYIEKFKSTYIFDHIGSIPYKDYGVFIEHGDGSVNREVFMIRLKVMTSSQTNQKFQLYLYQYVIRNKTKRTKRVVIQILYVGTTINTIIEKEYKTLLGNILLWYQQIRHKTTFRKPNKDQDSIILI